MPVGGIGAGQLYLGGDGRLWHWDIFNRVENSGSGGPHYADPLTPTTPLTQQFSLTIAGQTRILDRTGFSDISFRGEYPIGTVEYADAAVPLAVKLEAFSPAGSMGRTLAVDGQAGTILRALREHQMSADAEFLKRNWPRIRLATRWLIAKDADNDGLIESSQHNTRDSDWYGKVAWLSGLYLAALTAAARMADEVGDSECARECRRIVDAGRENEQQAHNGHDSDRSSVAAGFNDSPPMRRNKLESRATSHIPPRNQRCTNSRPPNIQRIAATAM